MILPLNPNAPACGCCGVPIAAINDLRSGTSVRVDNVHGVRLVAGCAKDPRAIWRCEKHVGRNPCCIAGCGRTFVHSQADKDGRGPEDYNWTIICGRHWRLAPKRMRDAVSRVRRDARRQGWTERNHQRHHRLWSRCRRAIEAGERVDMAEINRLFGWEAV